MIPTIRFKVNSTAVIAAMKPKPKEIARANRLVVNKLASLVHKDVGGLIPRSAGTSVVGFRRVRTDRKSAKAKYKKVQALVWLGGNKIAAKYAGKANNVPGGAKAGRHYFKDGFVATMSNGYTSVFRRVQGGKIKEATVDVPDLKPIATRSLARHSKFAEKMLTSELTKIIGKRP